MEEENFTQTLTFTNVFVDKFFPESSWNSMFTVGKTFFVPPKQDAAMKCVGNPRRYKFLMKVKRFALASFTFNVRRKHLQEVEPSMRLFA